MPTGAGGRPYILDSTLAVKGKHHWKALGMADKGSTLQVNGTLLKDDYLLSHSGQYQLILQQDGNLVIYDLRDNHKAIWASNTNGQAVNYAVMQADGNFVIYGYPQGIWASDTVVNRACFITMQDDGNLVIYEITAPLWSSQGGHT